MLLNITTAKDGEMYLYDITPIIEIKKVGHPVNQNFMFPTFDKISYVDDKSQEKSLKSQAELREDSVGIESDDPESVAPELTKRDYIDRIPYIFLL